MKEDTHSNSTAHPIHYLNFLKLYPSAVNSIHVHNSHLAVCREDHSELLKSYTANNNSIYFDELLRLPQLKHLFFRNPDILFQLSPFEARITDSEGNTKTHPFPTQLIAVTEINETVYTHHIDGQSLRWNIEERNYDSMSPKDSPFHIAVDLSIKGRGKILKPPKNIQSAFSSCFESGEYLYVGYADGAINIYETKFMTVIKRIKKHEAPILAFVAHPQHHCVYATGCDSKIICIREIEDEFVVTSTCRGQSHDIMAMALLDKNTLVSGGVSTDLCVYFLTANGDFQGKYENRVSLPATNLVDADNNKGVVVAADGKGFQLWKYSIKEKREYSDFLAKYKTATAVTSIAMSPNTEYLVYSLDTHSVVLSHDEDSEVGLLSKHMNLPPSLYTKFVEPETREEEEDSDTYLILVDPTLTVYLVNITTKQVDELFNIAPEDRLGLASNFDYKDSKLLVGSKFSGRVCLYNLKDGQKIFEISEAVFHNCGFGENNIIVLSQDYNLQLHEISTEETRQVLNVMVPIRKIRFFGQVPNRKRLFYVVGEARMAIVSNLFWKNDEKHIKKEDNSVKKHVRVMVVERVFQAAVSKVSLNFVGVNFKEMLARIENPIITKKLV